VVSDSGTLNYAAGEIFERSLGVVVASIERLQDGVCLYARGRCSFAYTLLVRTIRLESSDDT
jgi:hypothetical protein